ncbi:MAG: TetR/AcrR family transcriptional regulator [Maricaulaceae bacterium]
MSENLPVKNQRDQQAEDTREALIKTGHGLFGQQGYAATSAASIVARANVTRGALYHHFPKGKKDLFEAVVRRELTHTVSAMQDALVQSPAGWDSVRATLTAYFEAAGTPVHKHIVLQDAPSVLGWEYWREIEHENSVAFIRAAMQGLMATGVIKTLPLDPLSSLVFAASCEAALTISVADDPTAATQDALSALELFFSGLRC